MYLLTSFRTSLPLSSITVEPLIPPSPSTTGISDAPHSNTDKIMKKGSHPKGATMRAMHENVEEKYLLIHEIMLEWGEHEMLAGG